MENPVYDTDGMRLARIERKLNFLGEIACGAIGFGAAYAVYKIIAEDFGLGGGLGALGWLLAFGFAGSMSLRGFLKD